MSTTAKHVIELVKSLPEADQLAIREALAAQKPKLRPRTQRKLQRLPDGTYYNPDGIPNEDPVFTILEGIEEARHRSPGPPAPDFG